MGKSDSEPKKLFEYDPGDLDLELLTQLESALMAKLLLVCEELERRYQTVLEKSSEIKTTGQSRTMLLESTVRKQKLADLLRTELARAK